MAEGNLDKLLAVVAKFFTIPLSSISAETSAADVDGWDSVSQATLVFEMEDAFGITLDFRQTLGCVNLGEMAQLISTLTGPSTEVRQLPVIVFFGNCQSESLAACMRHHGAIAGRYDVHFVQSYTMGGDENKTIIAPDVLATCEILFEQLTPRVSFEKKDNLARDCRVVSYPSLDFNLLWPLHAVEPRSRREPDFPFGRYSYGDRIINAVVADGLSGDEAWAAYQARSAEAVRNIVRLVAIERQRWDNLDGDLSVKMADEIFARFRQERLFYTYNHPTSELLCRVGAGLLHAADLVTDKDAAFEELRRLFTWEFGADHAVPIHPNVAKALNLEWWSPAMRYRWGEDTRTYEDLIRAQIDWR